MRELVFEQPLRPYLANGYDNITTQRLLHRHRDDKLAGNLILLPLGKKLFCAASGAQTIVWHYDHRFLINYDAAYCKSSLLPST